MSLTTVTIDSIFKELGPFGRYNFINYALLLFLCYLGAMFGSGFNFEALDITYRCEIPQCESLNNTSWLEHAIPQDKGELSKCSMYQYSNISNGLCTQEAFNTLVTRECDRYVYSDEDSLVNYKNVVALRSCRPYVYARNPVSVLVCFFFLFNLACPNWKRTLVGTIHSAGFFVSLPLTGMLSDRFGRSKVLPIASLMIGICGIARSFSTSYTMLLIFEFAEAALGAMELTRPKGRVLGNTLINLVFALGLTTLAGLAWWLQNWRYLLRIMYTPAILVFSYLFILKESPRWLLSKGRYEEGIDILKKAAKMNKLVIAEEKLNPQNFVTKKDASSKKNDCYETKQSVFLTVIKSRTITTRLATCSYMWITCTFMYYGLSINSVSLAGNRYVNFILVALAEIPANVICLLVLDKFGRKRVLIIAFILSGVMCISLSALPKGHVWGPLVLYLCGKCCITVAYNTLYTYVSEVFSTNVRQSLLAVCSTSGKIGSSLAPLTPLLALYYVNLPAIFFGSLTLVAGLIVFILPETINIKLPDSIEEAEEISKKSGIQ